MNVVLIGATGATGKELLQLLLQDPQVETVVALVRRPLNLQHKKLQIEIIQFDEPESWKHLVQGNVAFSCLGTTLKDAGSKEAQFKVDFEYQYAFAKAASANNIPTFALISAGMANTKSLIFYSRMKGQLESAITELKFSSLIIFRPGLLLRPNSHRLGERWTVTILETFNKIGLLKKMTPLPVQDLARLMLIYGKTPPAGITILESSRIIRESIAARAT